MAKKGQPVQLQAEINTDDEWEKLLQKPGLILVDIYSEWCGPCSGMSGILKKLKLEIGGDTLVLAVAKSDRIAALERFRGKSEPTWMFISGGKMVNFMYGASAPQLIKVVTEELKKEHEYRSGSRERTGIEVSEMAEEEKERYEVVATRAKREKEKEEAKAAKELRARRIAECERILESYADKGIILIFPHARDKYNHVLQEFLPEAACVIQQSEKVQFSENILEELFYFTQPLEQDVLEAGEVFKKPSLGLIIKRTNEDLSSSIDSVINQIVYGNSREPPGDDDCPYQKLMVTKVLGEIDDKNKKSKKRNKEEEEEPKEEQERREVLVPGIWTPANAWTKAEAMKLLFPNVSAPFLPPPVPVIPLHVAVCYDAFKYKDVMELITQYKGNVLAYGFFTSDISTEAQLIAKNVEKFENRTEPPTYEEKMVVQLVKKEGEALDAFSELGPSYISVNAIVGEEECKLFFPSGYNEPEPVITEVKKKSKKKGKVKQAAPVVAAEDVSQAVEQEVSEAVAKNVGEEDQAEDHGEEEDDEEEDEGADDEEEDEENIEGADKSTSPMQEEQQVEEN